MSADDTVEVTFPTIEHDEDLSEDQGPAASQHAAAQEESEETSSGFANLLPSTDLQSSIEAALAKAGGRAAPKDPVAPAAARARPRATPFAQQHLKLHGPPNSGRSVAEWAPSLKTATDACVLASQNASPAQRLAFFLLRYNSTSPPT